MLTACHEVRDQRLLEVLVVFALAAMMLFVLH